MSEHVVHNPEAPKPDQEQNIVLRGLSRVIGEYREWRISQLEGSITKLQNTTEDVKTSMLVNKNTGRYARIEHGAGAVIKDNEFNDIGTTQEQKDAWKTKASHTSVVKKKAPDDTIIEPLRPTTAGELQVKRSVEAAEARTVRPSATIGNLHRIYDKIDTDAVAEQEPIPDRRPERGNAKARALIDESLRRNGYLKDQPARDPTPKVRIGTDEYRELVGKERLSKSQKEGLKKAEKILETQHKAVGNQVNYIESVADGSDFSAQLSERRIRQSERRIVRKQNKISKIKAKTS